MKSDEDVKLIGAEAPILFAKACEIFILELTLRAWLHTELGGRRTLQRNDIATAITETDMYDFLIDIVPRDDSRNAPLQATGQSQNYFPFSQQYLQMMNNQARNPSLQTPQSTNTPLMNSNSQMIDAQLQQLYSSQDSTQPGTQPSTQPRT
mmetsp:Transcript_15818/g.22025  ORF Transcript_15818/g.22025 Transcript_15818/m.22025 type:complete len:151 (+) Transcript_15818:168-620(+)